MGTWMRDFFLRRSGIQPRKPVSSLQQSSSRKMFETYIQPLSRYFDTYCEPGTIPGTGDTSVNKTSIHILMEQTF